MAGGLPARQRTKALAPADQRAHRYPRRCLAGGLGLRPKVAVEMCYRACKPDLAMESPRLWSWENRLKLLLMVMVSLVYAFLLSLIKEESASLVQDLLRSWRHRTGKRRREAAAPFSRIRAALSSLWLAYPPAFSICQETPG